jgi:hypothetical protein
MEKTVARTGWAAAALGCFALCPAWAQDTAPSSPQEALLAEARAARPVQLQVNASSLPRLEAQDSGFQAPRVDLSMIPHGANGLGVAVGMSGFAPRVTMLPSGYAAIRPSVDLGLTWRHAPQGQNQIDVTAWKRMQNVEDAYTLVQMREPVYGARVEMKLTNVRKAGLSVERGFIGMQLESGAKISIKRKNGGPMVYYRTAF